jgi:phosphatidylserine/phosphatidylglycerophosphate/cardiolipin synthase-like enzyme
MSIRVPAKTVPRAYNVGYYIANATSPKNPDDSPRTGMSYVAVAVTPDNYTPPSGMTFTHPYRKRYRELIRTHVLRTINSVPTGAYIQVASWSFASKAYRDALSAAKARGVAVQIVLAQRNKPNNSDYRRLVRRFGTTVRPTGSWVRKCRYSCRGTSGTMHSKIFLFSQVYGTRYVEMTGSANLTDFAVTNQWNQMNTVTGNKEVYDGAVRIFTEMYQDRPARPQYVEESYPSYPGFLAYFYPRGSVSSRNDFMLKALAPVRCRGAVNAGPGGRTIVKIAL